MAAALVTSQITSAVSTPPHIVSPHTALATSGPPPYPMTPAASSSNSPRSPPPPTLSATRSRRASSQVIPQPQPSSSQSSAPMTFKRLLRSPFEQTVRSATRSKGKPSAPGDHIPPITPKEGTQVRVTELMGREDGTKEQTGVLKRFETKVALRRTRKVSVAEAPSVALPGEDLEGEGSLSPQDGKDQHRFRLPRLASFVTPSLRLASLSSPAVNLSSNDSPSTSSPPPPSSTRPPISTPAPLTPKRPSIASASTPTSSPVRKSRPAPLLPPSPSTPTLNYFAPSSAPAPTTPTRPGREPVSSSTGTLTPTPSSSRNPQQQRQQLGKRHSVSTSRSSTDQPRSSPSSPSPSTSRQRSPSSSRTRSPPSSRVVTPRGFTSTSTSSLNYPPSYSTNALRRSSVDRRSPSPAVPRASSPTSPSSRPRALSPSRQQRPVSPSTVLTRHPNGSTTSVSAASRPLNPMHREALRTATSLLCKEMMRPVQSTGLGIHESEEVEARLQPLARLERVWGKSGASANGSVTQLGATGSGIIGGTAVSTSGEERERRLFTEALRDGYVLCLLMNKLRPGSIGRIDPREDGKLRMSNVTKFLASCSANGLPPEDLFLRDDLIEASLDSLARVAKTIIALVKWAETPLQAHSRISRGSGVLKPINTSSVVVKAPPPLGSPYRPGTSFSSASSSYAAMSSPNLSASPHSHSPSPSKSPPSQLTTRNNTRQQWTSPPSPPPSAVGVGLPTLRSSSPGSVSSSSSDTGTLAMGAGAEMDGHETPTGTSDRDEVPPIVPPRSPMRSRPSERSLIAAGAGESPPLGRESMRASVADSTMTTTSQSIASSSNLTDMTTYSSLLDTGINGNGRHSSAFGAGSSNACGKFGTIRTVTTEATSFVPSECPSMTRTEASLAAASMVATFNDDDDDAADGGIDGGSPVLNQRSRGSIENVLRPRDRKPSETVPVDLSRVIEESEESNTSGGGSSSGNVARRSAVTANGRVERIKLGQAKWPGDFLDAFKAAYTPSSPTRPIAIRKLPSRSSFTVSRSADTPRVMGHNEFAADLGALPSSACPPSPLAPSPLTGRRPTHRARHSVDTPMLAPQPKDTSLPQLPRESGPDSGTLGGGGSGSSPVRPRRDSTSGSAVTAGKRNGVYMSSPEDGANGDDDDDGDDKFVTALGIPFPCAVSSSGEYVPSPSPLNVPSASLSDSVERSSSNEFTAGTGSGSGPASASSIARGSLQPPPPRGRFQSEADGASSRRRRPRPNSYDEFGAKPQRRSRFESMANLGVASGTNASASDLMARNATEGSVSRQTLVVREDGKSPTHFQFGNCIGRGQFGSVYRALNLNTGQMVAVKRIGLEGLKEEEIAQLMREVDLVKRLSHPSIVKYEGMARDENTLSIVLEYAENGSLGQTLKAFGKLNEKLVASYVVKILEGLDYLHRSDVVHCDLKAANILTTKNGNVKLSDFGVSLNLRAMERDIKDVAGTPNWMAPEVIELKGASTKSDIWSLGCTVIELLTGRPPYGDIANAMAVMYRIVEDHCPPIPAHFSDPLVAFLKECFHKDAAQRPSAEQLFEHEWLKNHWGLNKDLRPQDSIPFLRRVSADLQKNDAARHLIASLDLVDASSPVSEFTRVGGGSDDMILSSSPGHVSFASASPGNVPEVPQAECDLFDMREHTFVKTTFSKPVSCRVCMVSVKKGAVLCSHCSLIAHSKCAGRAPPTCDLRSKLLMHAQFAECGSSPADIFTRLPPPAVAPASDGLGASSSRGSLDRERTSSPQLQQSPSATASPSSPTQLSAHAPVASKGFSPFKRSRASLAPDPTHSYSSISLAGATPPPGSQQKQQPIKSLLSEGNVIRRKLSIILTGQREPRQQQQKQRPLSISSVSSSLSPQDSQQSNSLRSLQTAAESISSRAARIDTSVVSAATGLSSDTGTQLSAALALAPTSSSSVRPPASPATSALRRASAYSGSDAAPPAVKASASVSASSASKAHAASTTAVVTQDTQRTRCGRGQSTSKTSNGNCAIQ